jgi:hypothetical protein
MSTRSTITLSTPDGYQSIYCHNDGYLSHNGAILKEFYDTEDKVKELIKLGSLSSLNKNLAPEEDQEHSFHKPASQVTVAYHRDRGEDLNIALYDTLEEVYDDREEYNYVFVDGQWWLLEKCSFAKFQLSEF